MALRCVIFDVDGTMADTEDAHRRAFNIAFTEKGFDWHWDTPLYKELLAVTGGKERIRYFFQRSHPEMLKDPATNVLIQELHALKTQKYTDLVDSGEVSLRPGVARLLAEARGSDVRLAIATTTSPENVTALLNNTLGSMVLDWFEVMATGAEVQNKKPSPEVYDYALQKLDLKPEQCIAIEDSRNGLSAALAANIATLITVNEFTEDEDFTDAMAVLSDLGEPGQPFKAIEGETFGWSHVDMDLLRQLLRHWHARHDPGAGFPISGLGRMPR